MKVEKMVNPITGRENSNQLIIFDFDDDGNRYFLSFQTIIAVIPRDSNNPVALDKNKWDCSTTISRYRNIFLGEKKAETQKKIDSGEYILTDLN